MYYPNGEVSRRANGLVDEMRFKLDKTFEIAKVP
jgi:hypothetical protein